MNFYECVKSLGAMKENDAMFLNVPNVDIVLNRIPKNIFNVLKNEIDRIQIDWNAEKYNKELVGHIEHEYSLNHLIPEVQEYIIQMFSIYEANYKIVPNVLSKNVPYTIESLWVNFQQKHEFNPPHTHTGIASFVIWMQIPYDLEKEEKIYSAKSNDTSKFGVLYTNTMGQIVNKTFPVDKSYEGIMCMFPSSFTHYVNPFYTSDDFRISVSGNIVLNVK